MVLDVCSENAFVGDFDYYQILKFELNIQIIFCFENSCRIRTGRGATTAVGIAVKLEPRLTAVITKKQHLLIKERSSEET